MLSKALMSSSSARIALVASKVANLSGSGYASSSILIDDLPIQTGDLIVFTSSSFALIDPTTISVTGYTSAYSLQTVRLRAATFYKTASSLESSINFEWVGGTVSDVSCIVAVFRGYQYNSSATASTSDNTINPPSISCSISDLIIATYHTTNEGVSLGYPTGYQQVNRTIGGDETATLMAYKIATGTTEDPPSIFVGAEGGRGVGGTIRCTPI